MTQDTPGSGPTCAYCGKTIKPASLTQWMFGGHLCSCRQGKHHPEERSGSLESQGLSADRHEVSVKSVLDGRYQIDLFIGEGGMGQVFRAIDLKTQEPVAIKVLREDLINNPHAVGRFRTEANATKALHHPNLVQLIDFGSTEYGAPYCVMEYIEGESLASWMGRKGRLEEQEALWLFTPIAEAMAHAHAAGIIHRDLKPTNILLTANAYGQPIPKVVDFGIAKLTSLSFNAEALTLTGELIGSPLYMSPEQCTGATTGVESDIYSLGCVMYEALTGRPPFAAENSIKVILQHLNEDPRPFPSDSDGLEKLEAVVLHTLKKSPEERYASMRDLGKDLELIKDGGKPRLTSRKSGRFRGFRDTGSGAFFLSNLVSKDKQGKIRFSSLGLVLFTLLTMATGGGLGAIATLWLSPGLSSRSAPPPAAAKPPDKELFEVTPPELTDGATSATSKLHLGQTSLSLDQTSGTDEILQNLSQDPNFAKLKVLSLKRSSLSDAGLKCLSLVSHLENLDVSENSNITDQGLSYLANLKSLRIVAINSCPAITAHGITMVAALPNLEDLNVSHERLSSLGKTPNLKDLTAISSVISDDCLSSMSAPKLQNLVLGNCPITDNGLDFLHNFPHISVLDLSGSKITDRCLGELAKAPLTQLSLNRTQISDRGLERLSQMKQLKQLAVVDCDRLSATAVQRLRGKMPACEIDYEPVDDVVQSVTKER